MLRLVVVALAICQMCIAAPSSSIGPVSMSSSYSKNPNGETLKIVHCGKLTCPEKADTCEVTKNSNDELTKIITTSECKLGNEVLLSEQSAEENKYGVSVKSIASYRIGQLTEDAARHAYENVQAVFALPQRDEIEAEIEANLGNTFGFFFPRFIRLF